MDIPAAVREWLSSIMAPADPSETPEPVGEGEDPTTETPDQLNPDTSVADTPAVGDPVAAAPGDAPVDENTDTSGAGDRTAPEPTSALSDSDRDAMNTVAAQNEALRQENDDLRTRIAELGGDAALGIVEEVVEDVITDPAEGVEDDYDAEADLAAQEAELARLRGE